MFEYRMVAAYVAGFRIWGQPVAAVATLWHGLELGGSAYLA